MMSRMSMIKRSLAWQLKRRGITVFAGAVILFGLGYLCARNDAYQWEPAELFSVYLGGSGGIDLMLLLWLFLNLPLRGFLWQLMLGECEKVERIKTLKYQSRSAVITMVLLTMAVFAAMYCGIGFGLMWLLTGRVSGVHIVLRAVLAAWEALAFVLLVFLLGRACLKLQQAAFPAVLIFRARLLYGLRSKGRLAAAAALCSGKVNPSGLVFYRWYGPWCGDSAVGGFGRSDGYSLEAGR